MKVKKCVDKRMCMVISSQGKYCRSCESPGVGTVALNIAELERENLRSFESKRFGLRYVGNV